MRWLAVFLVVVNAAFFAWHYWLPDPLGKKPAPVPIDVATSLDRLEEVDLQEFIKRTPVALGPSGGRAIDAACFIVGPLAGDYSEGSVMGRVREWLKSRGGRVGLRTGKYHELSYYWVYLPPAGTRDVARDRVRKLTAIAFGQAVVIPEGNMKNAVSIGVYGLRTALERDLTRLKASGFEPEVQLVRRTGSSLWFTAHFPPGYEFPDKRFGVAFEGLEVVDSRCPPPRAPTAAEPSPGPPSPFEPGRRAGPGRRPGPGPIAFDASRVER